MYVSHDLSWCKLGCALQYSIDGVFEKLCDGLGRACSLLGHAYVRRSWKVETFQRELVSFRFIFLFISRHGGRLELIGIMGSDCDS